MHKMYDRKQGSEQRVQFHTKKVSLLRHLKEGKIID